MLKDPRNLLWIIPLALLITVPLWKPFVVDFLNPMQAGRGPSGNGVPAAEARQTSEMTGIRFEQNKNGAKEWLLTADRLFSTASDADMRLEDVQALFFGASAENEKMRIRSQKARYDAATRQITLQGGVVIQNDKGYEMQTESLEYLTAEKKIRTTSPVNIQGSNIKVSGNQLVYNTVTGEYSLTGNVVGRIW